MFPDFDPNEMDDKQKWSLIGDAIEIAITEGMSRTQTARELRQVGFSFGDAAFRQLFDEKSDWRQGFEYSSSLRFDQRPNPSRMATSQYEITRAYGYVGRVSYLDDETGQVKFHTARIDSDELLTREEAEQLLADGLTDQSPPAGTTVSQVSYMGAMRNRI